MYTTVDKQHLTLSQADFFLNLRVLYQQINLSADLRSRRCSPPTSSANSQRRQVDRNWRCRNPAERWWRVSGGRIELADTGGTRRGAWENDDQRQIGERRARLTSFNERFIFSGRHIVSTALRVLSEMKYLADGNNNIFVRFSRCASDNSWRKVTTTH